LSIDTNSYLDAVLRVLEKRLAFMGFAAVPISAEDVAAHVPAFASRIPQEEGLTARPPCRHRLLDPIGKPMLLTVWCIEGGDLESRLWRAEDLALPLKHSVPAFVYSTWPHSFFNEELTVLTSLVALEGTSALHLRGCLASLANLATVQELGDVRARLKALAG
jgi:hypothetical protein